MSINVFFLSVLVTLTSTVQCQYYYKDLVSTQQINNTYRQLRQNKIKLVKLKSYQGNVPVEEGFVCEQRVNLAKNEVVTYTKTTNSPETYFTAIYNAQGLLSKTTDSSEESVSTTKYSYSNTGKLELMSNETHASDKSSESTETHHWEYKNNLPFRMTRIKGNTDSATIYFTIE